MIVRALILVLMLLWAGAAEAAFTYNGQQQESYGSNLLANNSFESTPTSEWPCSRLYGGGCYGSGSNYIGRVSTPVFEGGWSGYLKSQYDSYEGTYAYDVSSQSITLTANKEYKVEAYAYDTATSAGLTLKVTNTNETNTLCTTTDIASNQNIYTYLTCTVPNTNTITSARVMVHGSDTATGQPISYYVDAVSIREYFPPGTDVKLHLPAGANAGRKVYLYDTSGNLAYTATVDDATDTASIASVTTGTYFWYVTDVDGVTFLDNSDWVTVANGDDFTWTNSNLTKDATWGMTVAGDASNGYYMKLQRNGSDYLFMGSALGTNLASGKTASASSETNPASNAIDGDPNTKWYTSSTSGQWLCIDFGSAITFNRVIYYQRTENPVSETGYGGNSIAVQVSAADTGCSAGDMATITGGTESRKQQQFMTSIGFPAQTKRYVRLYYTSVYTRPEAYEIEVYNETPSNVASDMEYLVIRKDSDLSSKFFSGLRYDSYANEPDGSVTFTKNVSEWFNLSVNYKQMSSVSWRKRVTYSTSVDSASEFKFALHKYSPPSCVFTIGSTLTSQTDDHGACATRNGDSYSPTYGGAEYNFQSMAFGFPHVFGITPDAGCYAQWYSSPENYYSSDHEHVSGLQVEDNWTQAYTVLSRKQASGTEGQGLVQKPNFVTKAGQTYTFDVIVFRSTDPSPYESQRQMYASYTDGKGQALSADNKPLYAVAHQTNFITNNNDYCLQGLNPHDTGRGMTIGVPSMTWAMIGLSDRDLFLKNFLAYRKSTGMDEGYGNGSSVTPEDAFNSNPPSLINDAKPPFNSAILLGYAVQKGWVSVQASCSDYLTCVTSAERDDLLTSVNSYLPTSGTIRTYGFMMDQAGAVMYTNNWDNSWDSYANTLMYYYAGYKGLQATGASIDTARLNNLKSEIQALYDATDGYIHFSKFGHWRAISSGAASGGQFNEGAGDPIAPTSARFVAPIGGSATLYVRKANNYGNMAVMKNGVAISGSPFDLYDTSDLWSIYDINYEEIWNSGGYENLYGKQTRTYGSAPPVASEMYGKSFMVPHYKSVSFASSNNRIQIRAKSYTNGPTGIQVFFADGVDCTGISWSCRQYFPNVLPADGNWYDVELIMTDPNWTDGDSITMLRFDLVDQASLGTAQFDWVKVSDGVTPITISDFNVDGPFASINLGTVSTGDVFEFYATNTKNASSAAYKLGIDKVTIDVNTYEENNAAFACDDYETSPGVSVLASDCRDGYSLGWKRWKSSTMLLYELMIRNLYNENIFSDAQVKSHVEKLPTGNQGYGTFVSQVQTEKDACIYGASSNPWTGQNGYFTLNDFVDCIGSGANGGSALVFDLANLQLIKKYLNDDLIWYRFDEKTDRLKATGAWANEKVEDLRWGKNQISNIYNLENGVFYLPFTGTSAPYITKDVPDFSASYNRITLRVRNFKNGPTDIVVYFLANGCSWHTCSQTFSGVLTADNTWQIVNLDMTHANWTGNITSIDIQFNGATALDTLLVDYIRRSEAGLNTISFDEFYSPYYRRYVWKSSTIGDTLELTAVPFTDLELYMATGLNQGTIKVYFDNGSGYDAGTIVDLSTALNPVYTKAGLAYASTYKIKVEILSGTVRLDYLRAKTKPSYLMSERFKEEFYKHPYPKEYVVTDFTNTYFRNDQAGNTAQTYHLMYLGEALFGSGGFEAINPGLGSGGINAGINGRSNDEQVYRFLMQ